MARPLTHLVWALFAYTASAAELATVPPLEPGLNISVVITEGGVEYEGVRTIEAVNDAGIAIGLNWTEESAGKTTEITSATRLVRSEDLASANRMVASFQRSDPDSFPGSTAIQTSAAVFRALESGADAPIVFGIALGARDSILASRKYYRGSLRKVDETSFSLLLNGERVAVRALHAKGTLAVAGESGEAEFWWLYEPQNPLTLRWKFVHDEVQTVRIDSPKPARALGDTVAAGLAAAACRAELNGVYFDFGSAVLLPASDAALARVGTLLAAHRDWLVTIEGHTDSVGSDTANQDLSERRSAAVRAALTERFGVAAASLTARGFGETRPLESNDTVEGRARNRRVELSRDCAHSP